MRVCFFSKEYGLVINKFTYLLFARNFITRQILAGM